MNRLNRIYIYPLFILIILIPYTHKELFSVYLPDLIISKYLLLICCFIGIYFIFRYKVGLKDIFFILLFSFVIFQIISVVKTRNIFDSFKFIFYQTNILFVYIYIRVLIAKIKNFTKLVIFFYIAAYISVLLFLAFQILLNNVYGYRIGGIWPVPDYPTRYGSSFWDVNHFGIYIVSVLFILIGLYRSYVNKFYKIMIVLLFVFGCVAIYLTSSRSAMIALFVGMVFYCIIYWINAKKSYIRFEKLLYVIGLVTFLIPISLISVFSHSIKNAFLYRSVSFFSHLVLLKSGIEIGIKNIIAGVGINAFSEYFRSSVYSMPYFYIDPAAMSYKLPLHNLWLEVFTETGILSLVFYIIFWCVVVISLYKLYIKKKDVMALSFLCGIASFLVGGLFYSYKNEFFWIYVLLICAYIYKRYLYNINCEKSSIVCYIHSVISTLIPKRINIIAIFVLLLSFFTLLLPIVFIFSPINVDEIKLFYQQGGSFIDDIYYKILYLFMYTFGNYPFISRFVPYLMYISLYLVFAGIFSKNNGFIKSLGYTSIIMNIINIFYVVPNINIRFYHFYVLILLLSPLIYIFLKLRLPKINYFILFFSITLIIISILISYRNRENNYTSDVVFLTELAYNRKHFDNSDLIVNVDLDDLFNYYCNEAVGDRKYINRCNIYEFSGDKVYDENKKNIWILKGRDDIKKIKENFEKLDIIDFYSYVLIIYEPV